MKTEVRDGGGRGVLKGGFETVLPKKEKSNYARLPPFPQALVQKKKSLPADSRLRKSYYSRVLATSFFLSRCKKSFRKRLGCVCEKSRAKKGATLEWQSRKCVTGVRRV